MSEVTKYADISQRIGKWKGEIIRAGEYVKTLEISNPEKKPFKKNSGKTVVFRRWKNYGNLDWTFTVASTTESAHAFSAKHVLAEGIAPDLDQIVPADLTAVCTQYGMAYGFTDETYEFHEDDIPEEINRQLGVRKSTLEEMIDFAALQAGTQVIYAGGGLTRASVSRECTLGGLRQVGRTMMANQAPFQTPTSKTSQNYGSAPVMAGWPTFMHTNVLSDMRNLESQGWIPIERATSGRLHPLHRGNLEEYACIFSPHLQPVLGAGAAVGATGLQATGGYVDVYLTLVLAAGAWGKLNPQTANSMTPNIQMPNKIDKSDPLGQKGIAAMKFWACSVLLRDGYMERYEHGVKSLNGEF